MAEGYVCQQCGTRAVRWVGRCPDCNEWDSMVELAEESPSGQRRRYAPTHDAPQTLSSITLTASQRSATRIAELDRVLGGGIVPGSVVLVGGDPGIGKSTLLLQAADLLSDSGRKTLYVTAEESLAQIKLRSQRLGVSSDSLFLIAESDLNAILSHAEKLSPSFLVIDSIQAIYKPDIPSAPGTITQVRESAAELTAFAKQTGTALCLIGHVTKSGNIAGPRVLEHMVDTVLYFEGDRYHAFRVIRAVKNRFGSTNEIGIFEMRENGLMEVKNPSQIFLSADNSTEPGTGVTACIEGSRVLLVEIQALISRANFGTPERKVSGVDRNRVAMLLAVLEKRAGLQLGAQDVFVNAVGGARIEEPAADLSIATAMVSSFKNKRISPGCVLIGEVGLGGEIRPVPRISLRLSEAKKLGFSNAIFPHENSEEIKSFKGIKLHPARTLEQALELAM